MRLSALLRTIAAVGVGVLAATVIAVVPATAASAVTENPILSDGSYYSADPATLVVDDTLYVFAGHDEAGPTTNDFIMNDWQAFSTTDVDGGSWQHHPALMRPETVFSWATPGRAYAGQVVTGLDGRYYWYVPVHEAASMSADQFGIGVAVSDSPLGPWKDYAGAPIISQEILHNNAHNIDPTVLVQDGRVWIYWGSFGRLMGSELQSDMKTLVGSVTNITSGVDGYFEAPWLFERNDTYYLAYAANNAGPTSTCTPAAYHACIAYSTSSSPLGPWTYQGRILAPVSSTTSHPAITEFNGEWYMAYHTADAVGGNHFRRSVAIDHLYWDDSVTPAKMLPVTVTPDRSVNLTPRANVAPWATASASNEPIPTQYWINALNDELVRPNPLPPDMWSSYGDSQPDQWIQYDWKEPVRIDSARISFWGDQPQGSGIGVAAPSSWKLQYWDDGGWVDVAHPSGYGTSTDAAQSVTFDAVTTSRLRAVITSSFSTSDSTKFSGIAVAEWEVLAVQPDGYQLAASSTLVGALPELPDTVALTYGDALVAAPVHWDAVTADDVAAPGVFTVKGSADGYAAGQVQASVTVLAQNPWRVNLATLPTATPEAEYTAPWNSVDTLSDGAVAYSGGAQADVWASWSGDRPATRWAGYQWSAPVRIDGVTANFWSDTAGPGAGNGVATPASWKVQALVGTDWVDVQNPGAYGVQDDAPNRVSFDPIVATGLRVVLTAQTDGVTNAAVALSELEVSGETLDTTAPTLTLRTSGDEGGGGWWRSDATVRATAADDRDVRTKIDFSVDDGPWQSHTDVRVAQANVTGDGTHVVKARASDAAGNVSQEQSATVRIDTTRPIVTGVLDADARSVSATAADQGSGSPTIEYAVDAATGWAPYTAPVVAADQERRVIYLRSTDAAGNVSDVSSVTIPRDKNAPLVGNIARYATPTASFASGWTNVTAVNDGSVQGANWGTWPEVGEQWVQLEWNQIVTIDRAGVQFFRDAPDAANAGVIPPRSWVIQYFDQAKDAWVAVDTTGAYGRSSDQINEVAFAPVSTTRIRALMQSWGAAAAGGSSGMVEFQAWTPTDVPVPDTTAPLVSLAPSTTVPVSGWFTGAVGFTATATDAVDPSPVTRIRVDGGAWQAYSPTFAVGDSGEHLVEFEAQDAAGNISERLSATVRIDRVAPTTTVSGQPAEPGTTPVTLAFAATDENSGVERIEVRAAGASAWRDGSAGLVVSKVGSSPIEYRAVDKAGNVESTRELTVTIDEAPVIPSDAKVTLASDTVSAGASLAFTGEGFTAGEDVTVTLFSDPVLLITVRADEQGRVAGVVTIPAHTVAGAHHIRLAGSDSELTAQAALAVTGAPVTPGSGGGTTGTTAAATSTAKGLPATGVDPFGPLGLAILLLGMGAALVGGRRITGSRNN